MRMKDYFNLRKSKLLLLTLLACFAGGVSPAWADELTVANGTTTNSYIPFNAQNADYGVKGEYIIPSSDLIAMNGMVIKSIKLYAATNNSSSKPNYGPFQIFLKEVDNATPYSSSSSAFQGTEGATTVYEGTLVVSSNEMLITFTNDYIYGGGNLLIGFYKDKGGNYLSNNFYGVNQNGYTANSTYSSSGISSISTGTGRTFIPKTTFTYETSSPYQRPATLDISAISSNSAIVNWTAGSSDNSETGWDLEYKASTSSTWTEVHGLSVSTLSYTLDNLTDNTSYDVRVKALYGENGSDWKTASFKTPMAPITSFPWSEDFNSLTTGGTIPDGWDNSEGTTTNSAYKWCYNTNTSGNGATNGTGHEGKCIRFDSYNNSSNNTNFLKTPVMSFTSGASMQLKFWYKNPKGGDLSVYISNDGGTTYATELATGLTSASDWTEKVIDIPTEFVNNVVIVFKGTSNYGSGDAYIYLDDVLVKENAAYAMSISGDDVINNTIAFGEVKNTSTTKTFTISNDGASTLTGVSVVSSDATVFTVSDTNFDIAANATKDITVTFVKGVVGEYSETITISQTNITNDIVLTVTGSYATPSVAIMAVKVGDEAVSESVAFGSVGKQKSKAITIANTGEADLVISSITSSNTTDFTVSPSTLTVQGGSSETFTVTFLYGEGAEQNVEKTANITVTPSNEGLSPVTFAVTGTRIEQWSEDFSGNALPEGWETTSTTYWTFADGVAKSTYNNTAYYLTTPSLVVEEGESLSFDACLVESNSYRYLTVQKQKDNGAWESCMSISYSEFSNTADNWKTFTISGLNAGNYKFRFQASGHKLDNFEGFKRNMNDPKLGIYSDAECTAAVATSVTKDFGFATETQTATYYIKNDGTGTMTLSLGDAPDGITQTLDKTSVTAGDKATLTITMPVENKGFNGGNVVVTATNLGTFTVAVSGVIVEEGKLNLDFATATIPSTWTASNWSKNASGYMDNSAYSSGTIETSNLTAEADEEIVIEAKMYSTSTSYTFGVNYKKIGTDTEWQTLIATANIGTEWVKLHTSFAEAGTYQLQFVGTRAQIRHIYGLSEPQEPVMAIYDGENLAAATHDFGSVSDEDDATWTLTVKNEGHATLTGLAATLTGDNADHYSYTITGATGDNNDEIAAGAQATILVKQLKDNLGSHSATLTISATNLDSKVIALSGNTYDHTKLFVDFENNDWPADWTSNSWTITTTSGNYHARAGYNVSSLLTSPLTVAQGETLTFKAKRQYNSTAPTFQIRYTSDGGATWTEYVDYASQVTSSSFATIELTGIPTGTVVLDFNGRYVDIDDISGFAPTTAPVISLTEGTTTVANGSTKAFGDLTATATATYTLGNIGNEDLVSTLSANEVTFDVTASDDGVTREGNTLTIPAGKTATITVYMTFAPPYGEKSGSLTFTSEGWVGNMTVNYTATIIDPTAVYVDFADNSKPEGWYNSGWTISTQQACNYSQTDEKVFVTSKLSVAGADDVLTFDTKAYYDGYAEAVTVSYSTDRKNWTDAVVLGKDDISGSYQTFEIKGLAAGEYYLKFAGTYVYLDNIVGWHKVAGIEHDLYIASDNLPLDAVVPGSEYTATITVASLRADESGLTAALWMQKSGSNDAIKVADQTEQSIDKDASNTFTLTGNVPTEEGTYQIWANIWNDNGDALTEKYNIEVAHIRTLEITEFTKVSPTEEVAADDNNQFDAEFTVTLKNTGTTGLTADQVSASVLLGAADGEVQLTKTAETALAVDGTVQLTLTGKVSAGAGGEVSYYAKENLSNTVFATAQTVTVTAQAALFAINTDGSTQDFGLVRVGDEAKKTYTITNGGNKILNVSIATPEGFSCEVVNTSGSSFKFTNNQDWSDVYAFAWNANTDPLLGEWPGTQIQWAYNNESNQGVYIINVPDGAVGIVVNNATGSQTVDITDFAQEGYYTDGSKDGSGYYYVTPWPASSNKSLTIAAGETGQFAVVMNTEAAGKKSGNVTITTNAADVASFEIPVEGRVISADTWTEDFATEIPASWTNNGWEWNSDRKAAYSTYSKGKTLMTPRLAAEANEELTFDVIFPYSGEQLKVQYSTDKTNWTDVTTYSSTSNEQTFEGSFTAPAAGNYYLKFGDANSRYVYVDNFVGFKLNPLEHDVEIAASSVPATGTQYAEYTATVTLKENAGKDEEVTAKLYVNNEEKATQTETITANGQTVITLTWTPDEAIANAVEAYIAVTGAEGAIALETEKVDLTIAAPYELDETVGDVANATYPSLLLKHSFVEGWNTICLPFTISVTDIHANAVAFSFDEYNTNTKELTFNKATELAASKPYVIYVPEAISTENPFLFNNVEITYGNTYPDKSEHTMTFQGTYKPMAAGSLTGCYGLTAAGKIAKAKESTTMKGFRAYFKNVPADARVNFVGFDESQGIRAISVDTTAPEGTYNLNGQKVENLKKGGLYIINGKKQIVK